MTTDTSERGLERLLCTALTGYPCETGRRTGHRRPFPQRRPAGAAGALREAVDALELPVPIPALSILGASDALREAVDAGAIKPFDPQAARKLMRYVPFWA